MDKCKLGLVRRIYSRVDEYISHDKYLNLFIDDKCKVILMILI